MGWGWLEKQYKIAKENSLKYWYNNIQGVIIMKSEKELFELAKSYVMLLDLYRKDRLDKEELEEEMDKIRNTILEKGYDVDKFVEYQKLYRNMTIAEYYEFIKTL